MKVLSATPSHRRTNNTLKVLLFRSFTQVIKPQVKRWLTGLDTTRTAATISSELYADSNTYISPIKQVHCTDLLAVRRFLKSQIIMSLTHCNDTQYYVFYIPREPASPVRDDEQGDVLFSAGPHRNLHQPSVTMRKVTYFFLRAHTGTCISRP